MADRNSWESFADIIRPTAAIAADKMGEWGKGATDQWVNFKKEHPETALALSVLPVSGQVTAAADYYDAIRRGDSVDGALAAAQFLPFGGVVKAGRAAGNAVHLGLGAKRAVQTAEALANSQNPQTIALLRYEAQQLAQRAAGNAGTAAVAGSTSAVTAAGNLSDYWKSLNP